MESAPTPGKRKTEPGGTEALSFVVGIGASAGGLEALRALIARLPAQSRMAFIIAQHLSPSHPSLLAQLLERETALPVRFAAQGETLAANTVYVAPANANIQVRDGRFRLSEPFKHAVPKPSVDYLLASLAEEFGERVIAVILSGTGSDGAVGVRAVKAAGGFVVVQSEDSAKYGGMPRAALDTGCVDRVLVPAEIAAEISRIEQAGTSAPYSGGEAMPEPVYERVLNRVRQRTGVDFSKYKESTLRRRLGRRLLAVQAADLEAYDRYVDEHPEEAERLYQDVLISVTAFFRDDTAFEALGPVLDKLIAGKRPGDEIRVWVPGCATGEEVYSIAILLAERLGARAHDYRVQIFATDIDARALANTRRGEYHAASLADTSDEWLARHFSLHGDCYQVAKRLRDWVVVARHDLTQDPPFVRLDLVSCRNVLIYFKAILQEKVLEVFHYALKLGGYLMLGQSETVGQQPELFAPLPGRARLFRRKDVPSRPPLRYRVPGVTPEPAAIELGRRRGKAGAAERMHEALLTHYAPPAVLVDDTLQVRRVQGDVSPFLKIAPGEPNWNLASLLRRELRGEARSLVTRAGRTHEAVSGRVLRAGDDQTPFRMAVRPLPGEGEEDLYLLAFEPAVDQALPRAVPAEAGDAVELQILRDELSTTREHLQTVIEELEASNEELQSLNEELQSSNEELQSTNEELETSNEELQSTNEELSTVNEELQTKTTELAAANADLGNVKNSLADPWLVVDERLRLKLFNPAALALYPLAPFELGQILTALTCKVEIPGLKRVVERVIAEGQPAEQQLSDKRDYLLRVRPYRDAADGVRGAVLSFFDNTEVRRAEQAVRENATYLQAILDNLPLIAYLTDELGRYLFVNRAFAQLFGVDQAAARGKSEYEILGEADAETFAGRDAQAFSQNRVLETEDGIEAGGRTRTFLAQRFLLFKEDGNVFGLCMMGLDITARKEREEWLRLQAKAMDASINGILITDARAPDMPILYANDAFVAMTGYDKDEVVGRNCRFLQGEDRDQAEIEEIRTTIRAGRPSQALLRNYRKDGRLFFNELTISPMKGEHDELTHFIGIQNDVTARVTADRAVRAREAWFARVLDEADIGRFELEPSEDALRGSDAFWALQGVTEDPSYAHWLARVDGADRAALEAAVLACAAEGVELDVDFTLHHPFHGPRRLLALAFRVLDPGGPARLSGVLRDLTPAAGG